MPTMVTFRAGRVALLTLLAGMAAACSQEQQDWRSAQAADSTEAWQRFVDQHPDSELVNQARNRIAQLDARRDFEYAERVGTVDAYRDFLTHHPSGTWSEHARIRIESFSLGSTPRIEPPPTPEEAAAFSSAGVRALRLATAALPADAAGGEGLQPEAVQAGVVRAAAAQADAGGSVAPANEALGEASGRSRAAPGEAAQLPEDAVVKPAAAAETGQAGYGVQLGAFGSEASADQEWRRLQVRFGAELGNLSPRIVIAESDARQFYRLQVPASGQAQARALCDSLKEQAQACVPVVTR
jgi:cell division septation protein DedD